MRDLLSEIRDYGPGIIFDAPILAVCLLGLTTFIGAGWLLVIRKLASLKPAED